MKLGGRVDEMLARAQVAQYKRTEPSPFAKRALSTVSKHPIVRNNAYTEWFRKGDASIDQANRTE